MKAATHVATAVLVASSAFAQPSRGALASGTIAIERVNLIPMTRDTVLRDMTVVIRDGRISAITPARGARIPNGSQRVDGREKFLIPGLADAHTHLFADAAEEAAQRCAKWLRSAMTS